MTISRTFFLPQLLSGWVFLHLSENQRAERRHRLICPFGAKKKERRLLRPSLSLLIILQERLSLLWDSLIPSTDSLILFWGFLILSKSILIVFTDTPL